MHKSFTPCQSVEILINRPGSIRAGKKSISPPHLWGLDYITPQPMKQSISPPELCKTGQITPITVLKNHNKSQKNHKMENPIVLD
jgi:hypothetical protein